MPHAAVNGTNIYYHESGHGLPVVLMHGFPLDHRIWHNQVHDLSARLPGDHAGPARFRTLNRAAAVSPSRRWPRIYISCSRRFTRCRACWADCPWAATLRWRMSGNMPRRFAG